MHSYTLITRYVNKRLQGYVEKMFRMVMAISVKENIRLNGNTFELVIEELLRENKWKESLLVIRAMEQHSFKPSIAVCVTLVEQLERARQFKAVLAMYRYMVKYGYDFYENTILNGVFKRLVSVASLSAGVVKGLKEAVPLSEFLSSEIADI